MRVAIQPDDYGGRNTPERLDSSSPRWAARLEEAGVEVRFVDVARSDILSQVAGCHGFMWRHGHLPRMRQIARRLLPVLERELGLVMYPDQATCWHYDDKVTQKFLFEAAGIPTPRSWVLWKGGTALDECLAEAGLPVVLKLWGGAASSNVRLLRSRADVDAWVARLFGDGVFSLDHASASRPDETFWDLHREYALVQEFLPGNAFDTRITVIGHRAFGYRRFNRPNDFRASGSGLVDYDPHALDPRAVRLAFHAARLLGGQSLAFDILKKGDELVIGEVSYTYVSWMVKDCPGHWELTDAADAHPDEGELAWVDGHMWPEDAQVQDYLVRLRASGQRPAPDV